MKFCKFCGSMLEADTRQGVLRFHCIPCNKFFDSTEEDSIRREIDYEAAKSSEKYRVMEEIAPFDSCGLKVDYDCPVCKMPYLTHIYIGDEYVSKYVCVCGFKVLSKDFKSGKAKKNNQADGKNDSSSVGASESMIGSKIIEKNLQNEYFEQIREGAKTIEGRLNKSSLRNITPGTKIKWWNEDKSNSVLTEVVKVTNYATFEEMLTKENIKEVLPGVTDISEGVSIYRKFYSEDDETKLGVLAIHLKKAQNS